MKLKEINWYRGGDYITFILPWVLAILLMVGCSTIKYVPIEGETIIEYRDTTIFIKDTIEVEVPREVIKEIVPADTTSILKTSVAQSTAKIEKGMLHHQLEQKGTIPVQIDTIVKVEYVDKYIYEEVPIEVVKEVKYTPDWAWYSLIFNVIALCFIIFKIYLKFKK